MKYRMCFEFDRLKDGAAFEDLATELGVPFTLVSVEGSTTPVKPVVSAKPTKPRKVTQRRRRYHNVTAEHRDLIKKLIQDNPEMSYQRILNRSKLPHSLSTINRIVAGKYDHK